MRRYFLRIGFSVFCVMMLGSVADAVFVQNMSNTVTERRVRFARGKSQTTIKGSARYARSYVYLLEARAGQQMSVELKSRNQLVKFSLIPAGESKSLSNAFLVSRWTGRLPSSGDCKIVVVMNEQSAGNVPYTLTISIR